MKLVSNSSPIIVLAKLNALGLLDGHMVYIPKSVKEEILAKECAEKDTILKFLKGKNIHITAATKKYTSTSTLGKGEIEVINLAKEKRISTVLLDDRRARSHAKLHDLQPKGTIWLMLQANKKKHITSQEAKKLIYHLPETGFYLAEKLLVKVLEILEK